MKKTVIMILVLSVLSSVFSLFSSAVIQSPPKDKSISLSVYKTDETPDLDGVIRRWEYKKLDIPQSSLSYVVGSEADWPRAKKTEFEAYASVFDGRFNFALSVKTDEEYYITDCDPKYMWAQTSLLLSLAKKGTSGRNALEIGIRPDGEYFIWNRYNGIEYSPENGFAAVYKNGVITYEISVPLSAFGAEDDKEFLFCCSISSGDYFNGDRQVYVQYGQGISGFAEASDADTGKDAALFPKVYILNEGEEPVTEEPQTTEQTHIIIDPPDTGVDLKLIIIVSVSFMALSLVVFRFLKLKKIR